MEAEPKPQLPRLEKPVRVTEQLWPEGTMPVVSIWCITYNHANFIRDAIEGFLMQETTFPVEIFIHDDASTDGTADIVRAYADDYPNLFWTVLQGENQWSLGIGSILNYLKQQRGRFLALCEGDDYWTTSHKLEKQVGFLEKNPEYSFCFHRVEVLQADGTIIEDALEQRFNQITQLPACRLDLLKLGNFINTASVLYRNCETAYPPEFGYSPVGDYLLHIVNSERGPIHRFEEIMAVYRRGVGIYSALTPEEMQHQILKYSMCVLSFLTDEIERIVVLKKCLQLVDEMYARDISIKPKSLKDRIKAIFSP